MYNEKCAFVQIFEHVIKHKYN